MPDILSAEEALAKKGFYPTTVVGVSMLPLLRQNVDTVIIEPLTAPAKKYDVVLFRRDGQLVLHRIVAVEEDCYIIRGDNAPGIDRVPPSHLLGKMTQFTRSTKQYSVNGLGYKLYSRLHTGLFPLRQLLFKIKRRLHGA